MSRKFRFHVGPRTSDEARGIIETTMREARDGDEVTVNVINNTSAKPDDTDPRVFHNEGSEKRIGESVQRSLEQANAAEDKQAQSTQQETPSPQAHADRIVKARQAFSMIKKLMAEQGIKIACESVLRAAWAERENILQEIKDIARSILS